jgi:hypothetical protein
MGTRIYKTAKFIITSKLLKTKKGKEDEKTANIIVAAAV